MTALAPVSVALKFGFLVVLYLFLMWIARSARRDLRDDLLKSTPLAWACRWGRIPLVEVLLSRGAPIHEPDAEPWATPLAWARKMNRTAIVALLSARA